MALTGSVMAPLVGVMLLLQIKVAADHAEAMSRHGREAGGEALWLFVILIATIVRSLVHRMAGIRLWRDAPTDPPWRAGITAYAGAAAAHTALWLLFLKVKAHAPVGALLGAAVLLMAWPVAVLAITRLRRFRDLGPRPPVAEDNGFEGLAVLMSILGFCGLVVSIAILVTGISVRDQASGLANVLMLAGVALIVRSIIHVSVGARAVRGTAVNAAADFLRYAAVGIAIGAAVGLLATLWLFIASIDFFGLATGVAVTLALVAWPAIVRRFVTWRHLADVAAEHVRRRSPDAGITALGWLLLAGGAAALGAQLAPLLWGDSFGHRTSTMMMQMAGMPATGGDEPWLLALAGAQLWAALELLAVTPRRRLVASAWALAALVVTVIEQAPGLEALLDAEVRVMALGLVAFALTLALPAATLLLVNRRPPAAVTTAVRAFE